MCCEWYIQQLRLVYLILVKGFLINILFYFIFLKFILGWYIECQLKFLIGLVR